MRALTPSGLVSLAIAEGATSPNPGGPALAWSSTLSAPVVWTGSQWTAVDQGGASSGPSKGLIQALALGNNGMF